MAKQTVGNLLQHWLLGELYHMQRHHDMSLLPEVLYLVERGTTLTLGRERQQPTGAVKEYLSNSVAATDTSLQRQKSGFQEIRLPNINLNVQGESRAVRPKTATLNYPKVLHTPPLGASKPTLSPPSALGETCHFCGRQFGRASIAIHEKQCHKKLLLRHNHSSKAKHSTGISKDMSSYFQHRKTSTLAPARVPTKPQSVKQHTRSLVEHEKRITHRSHSNAILPGDRVSNSPTVSSGAKRLVGRVVTVGLVPGKIEYLYFYSDSPAQPPPPPQPRPSTRALGRSSLRASGFTLPSPAGDTFAVEPHYHGGGAACEYCGESVSPDRIAVHSRICKRRSSNTSPPASRGINVTLPSLHNLLRVNEESQPSQAAESGVGGVRSRKPRTVVCYICGREYGTKSIAIHEPQCMKKWQAENRRLPIRDRKPLPKKKEEVTRVTCVAPDRDLERVIQPTANGAVDSADVAMQRYFEQCYSEFEKELIPCKKCGRTFAPERHFMHEPSCNAEPL